MHIQTYSYSWSFLKEPYTVDQTTYIWVRKLTETPGRWEVFSLISALISWRSKSVRPQEGQDTYSYSIQSQKITSHKINSHLRGKHQHIFFVSLFHFPFFFFFTATPASSGICCPLDIHKEVAISLNKPKKTWTYSFCVAHPATLEQVERCVPQELKFLVSSFKEYTITKTID